MEIWEKLIDACTSFKDIISFKKAISSARIVLSNDLTVFELDWFVSTLLHRPVNLLGTLQEKQGDSLWIESIVDALALLANLLQTHNGLHHYYHQIVQVCSMVSNGASRTPALTCLLHTSHHSAASAANLQHLIAEFECPRVSSRGPLGLLIGSICRSWPQVIEEQGERVWRVFLQVLEDEKLSGTARAAVLEGASGILSACGPELPTADLLGFYNLLRTAVFLHPRCLTVCMRILRCHVALFSERASEDTKLRMRLWELGVEPAYLALSAIYHHLARNSQLYTTLAAEVVKYAGATQAAARVVALRALHELHTLPDSNVASPLCYIHVPKLECKLRGDLQNDDVVLIAWCIETGVSGASELVSAWIERNTPLHSSREQQLARAVLAAPYSLRKWTIHAMVTKSCCTNGRQRCTTLCKCLCDVSSEKNSENESDSLYAMAEMLDILVEEVLTVARGHSMHCGKQGDCEPIAGISALVCVALRSGNSGAVVAGARLVGALSSCGVRHPAAVPAALSAALASPLAPSTIELKTLRVESLRDAETQWQCCEVVCSSGIAPPQFLANFTLAAAEIVLSSGRTETTLLCACVRTLAALVRTHRDSIDKTLLNEVSKRIDELPARSSAHSRIERELRREILLFLGQCPLETSDNLGRHATPVILYDIDLEKHNIASALEAATHTPSLEVENAQKMADYLSKILRFKRPCDPPISILTWLARSGADLLPFAAMFPQRALPELFQSVERERSAVTRKALAALATAVLKTLPPEEQEMQLRFLLTTDQDSTLEGSLEILLAASRAVRDDSVSLRAEILKALAVKGGLHLASLSPVSCLPPADVISSLLSGPLPPGFDPFNDRLVLERVASDYSDLVVEAIDDNCNFNRLLNVLNEIRGSPGLSRRVCLTRDGLVPSKLFALECSAPDVAFQFIAWNAEVLMEINSEATIETVCRLIASVKIDDIRAIRNLAECVQRVTHNNSDVNKLYEASENWLRKQELCEVTRELRRYVFKTERWQVVQGVRGMIKASGVKPDVVGEEAVNWGKAVRDIYDTGIERYAPHRPYLMDVLCVALPALNIQEFEQLFDDDVSFCKWAVPALVYLIELKGNEHLPLKKSQIAELLPLVWKAPVEIVDRLWADFESNSTFEEKIEAALVIGAGEARLWAERIVLNSAPPLQVLQLLPLLPSDMRRRVASSALVAAGVTGAGGVACAKEGVAVAAVRALLAATPTLELVDIIATLADDEMECDWFEAALSQWARNAAANACAADILTRLHELCWDARTLGVLRVLVPMLRAIDSSLVEDLMSQWSNRLIGAIRVKPRPGGDQRPLIRCLNDYVRALTLLTIAFERVPRAHHERPDAKLHQELSSQPFQLVRQVSTLCVALRESVRTAYDDNLRELFRVFECANFKCLSSALFCRQGAPSTFRAILDDAVWQRLVQTSITLPIISQSHATPRPGETASVQSRVFLTTLTDDPLLYDLHEGVQMETSEAEMGGQLGAIWVHECTNTLSVLLRHSVRALPPDLYLTPIRAALATSRTRPLRWLLAQAVCDVPSLVDTLRDDLLAVALDTLENGLNAIQLYVIGVVKPVPLDVARATGVLTALVQTAVELESRAPRLLTDTLESWSRAHAGLVLPDTCYTEYVADSGRKRWSCMSVMRRVCSSGIRMAGLVGELGSLAVTAANDMRTLRSIGATLGCALTADAVEASDEKVREAMVAVRKRGGAGAYLTLLAAAASVYPALVNAENARIVTDMATKIIGRDKQKCLRILCAFAKNSKQSDEQIADIFDLVEPTVSLTCDPLIIDLCTAALPYARQAARERVVTIAEQLATPTTLASPSLQRAAYLLLFAEITRRVGAEREGRKEVEPPTKRRAGCVYSPILSLWEDMAWRGVLRCTVYALDHTDSNIVKGAFQALSKALSVDDRYTRLSETVLLCCTLGSRGFDVLLRLFFYGDVKENEKDVLESLLSVARGSEAVTCVLAGSVAQVASGGAAERERLVTILAENVAGGPVIVELLHALVPAGTQVEYGGTVSRGILRELRQRATLTNEDHYTLGNISAGKCISAVEPCFSIKAMSKCFGWLCEWDRWGEGGERSCQVPQLWTDNDSFRREMETYIGEVGWFRAMWSGLDADRDETGLYRLLLAADRWPRDTFTFSAVWELEMWKDGEFVRECDWLERRDRVCLAQTAALLMMRSLRLQSSEEHYTEQTSALHENMIRWCSLVNNIRGAPENLRTTLFEDVIRVCSQLELGTIDNGIEELVSAKRGLAVLRNSPLELAEALEFAQEKWCELSERSKEPLRLMQLVLKLRADTNSVNRSVVEEAMTKIKESLSVKEKSETRPVLATIAEHLFCLYERTTEFQIDSHVYFLLRLKNMFLCTNKDVSKV
ncbi:uncharacterized protein LOC123715256 isoform X2 [Pieris brassicae]|uniref:uncharacterized protein LOC123715256 isoform X2 n=1 Tax=Pieris brassicae TaxID=7116 RepID=UPI001E65E64D|nr:uncharacterized protein LOC123715256 isoform X2 [Pieris brassicae]